MQIVPGIKFTNPQIVPGIKFTNPSPSKATVNPWHQKINPQVRLTAMIATDSKPWIRLPLTDEGLQGLSHRRIHSVGRWTETMLGRPEPPRRRCLALGVPPIQDSLQPFQPRIPGSKSKHLGTTLTTLIIDTLFHHLFFAFNFLPHDF